MRPKRLLPLWMSVLVGCGPSPGGEGARAAAQAARSPEVPTPAGAYRCGSGLAPDPVGAAASVRADYRRWLDRYVVPFGSDGLLRVDAGREYGGGTPSEAIGYGMLLAAYLGDRATFDGLWTFAIRFRNPRGLMAWSISPDGRVLDGHAATDGDADMAFALLVAQARWGGFDGDARRLIGALLRHGVEAGTDVFKPGDVVGGSHLVNPSYFAPAYYRWFAAFTGEPGWLRVVDTSYRILDRASRHSSGTGLQPEWSTAAGDSSPDPYGYPFHHGYNATRVAWRLAVDAAWNCDPRALRHLARLNGFFRRVGPEAIVDGYTLGGRPIGRYHNAAFVGPAAAAAVLSDDAEHRAASWREVLRLGGAHYYNDSLRLLAMLFGSGGMPPPSALEAAPDAR